MKKRNRIALAIVALIALLSLTSGLGITAFAASNPYPTSQTVGGVVTRPCTNYAWQQAYDRLGIALPNWGNAINWYYRAPDAGYEVGTEAAADSIAVWSVSSHAYGHVAYVSAVNGSEMTVNEGGRLDAVGNNGIVNGEVLPATVGSTWEGRKLIGFVYLRDASAEAVAWAKSKIGVGVDYDCNGSYQCVDLIYAYYNYLGVSVYYGNACDYINADAAVPSGSGWTRISSNIVPQPGDIAVYRTYITAANGDQITGWGGHVGIVTSGNSSTFSIIHQNYLGSTVCGEKSGIPTSYLACVIRPNFSSTSGKPVCTNHTKGEYLWNWAEHPHYKCYRCTNCGVAWEDRNEPTTVASCAECNPTPTDVWCGWCEYPEKHSIGTTNAVLAAWCNLNVDCSAVSKVGIYLYDYKGDYITDGYDSISYSGFEYMSMWYDVNSELDYTLKEGTPYKYKFYMVINGGTYYSPEYDFTTGGTHTHELSGSSVTTPPSCTVDGSVVRACLTCGEKDVKTLPAPGHSWKTATCTAPKTCTTCGTTSGSALGHSYGGWTTTQTPTCTAAGTQKRTCTRGCGASQTQSIAAKGHSYVGGTCTVCKYVYPMTVTTHNGTYAVSASGGANIWSKPYSTGTSARVRTAKQGATLSVVGKVTNYAGSVWYKLSDGSYIYSGNVKKTNPTYNPVDVTPCGGTFTVTSSGGANVWSKPFSTGSSKFVRAVKYGANLTVTGKVKNTSSSLWYQLSDGNWIYSGNITRKTPVTYSAASVIPVSGTYTVTSYGANIWSQPYTSGNAKVVRTAAKGAGLAVAGKVTNTNGDLWYKLSDGNWVYGSNVTRKSPVTYNPANVVPCSGTYSVISYGANIWTLPYTSGAAKCVRTAAKGANLTVAGKVVNTAGDTWYKLSDGNWVFGKNVTRKSAVSYKTADVVPCSGTYTVTSYGANLWSKPYTSGSTKVVRTAAKGATLTVTGRVINSIGETWYKLSDGSWVYGANVTRKSSVAYYSAQIVSHKGTYTVVSFGANIWNKAYTSGVAKVVRTAAQGAKLSVVGKVYNTAGELWYKLSDGNWIYSNNVAQ